VVQRRAHLVRRDGRIEAVSMPGSQRGTTDWERAFKTAVSLDRPAPLTPFTAVPIAAGILLDVFNVFLLVLDLFGSRRDLARPCRRERRAQG
jgi:hypothetical protein